MLNKEDIREYLDEKLRQYDVDIPMNINKEWLLDAFCKFVEDDYDEWLEDNFKAFFLNSECDWK